MFIEKIILNNYRAFKGSCSISFDRGAKNIYLIAGDNGFGKTTILTSLVWCLYGKLMSDVDEKFKKDISDAQGYKNYAIQSLNNECYNSFQAFDNITSIKKIVTKLGYAASNSLLKNDTQYSVSVIISEPNIPSIPCNIIEIRRTFDALTELEDIEIFIDGQPNQLTTEVGNDIFINDFILSKEIAKFFFFDAEKIVSIAEMRSVDEKRKLGTAYSEVLGIKKYEDVKKNLETLRIKYRRKSSDSADRLKLNNTISSVSTIQKKIDALTANRENIDISISESRTIIEQLQEKLIREGNAISVEELLKLKELCEVLRTKEQEYKAKLKDMLDIAPFAISGKSLVLLKEQIEREKNANNNAANKDAITSALNNAYLQIMRELGVVKLPSAQKCIVDSIIDKALKQDSNALSAADANEKILLQFSEEEENEFQALFDNIRYSYSHAFKQLVKDEKNNRIFLTKTLKKISQAESEDSNSHIKYVRMQKVLEEEKLKKLETESRKLSEDIGLLRKELNVKSKLLSELTKKVSVDDSDKEKDAIAERLIDELSLFLSKLKEKKKDSIERKIRDGISMLMHKVDFINSVNVELKDDIIDIALIDKNGVEISKDKLSKGEQQLYATAILKALVDESGIEFPVFIDSPLQKFDARHSSNIITKFYPSISKQVVIFPLLGKELSKDEYESLLPQINGAYVIRNNNNRSSIESLSPTELFKK